MHPYGGTPICPRCNKAVYAAEQVMGPGRKLYHKPCLSCMICKKRLDSYNLVEHNHEPYCKNCHVKTFGTRDLRHANLPTVPSSPPLSPTRTGSSLPSPPTSPGRTLAASPPPLLGRPSPASGFNGTTSDGLRRTGTLGRTSSPSPILRPNRTHSPRSSVSLTPLSPSGSASFASIPEEIKEQPVETNGTADDAVVNGIDQEAASPAPASAHSTPSDAQSQGEYRPRLYTPSTIPSAYTSTPLVSRSLSRPNPPTTTTPSSSGTNFQSSTVGPAMSKTMSMPPLQPTMTGTRYGAALGGSGASIGPASPLRPTATGGAGRSWGGGTPQCGKCGKSVYFAEQVKAVGKTFHKNCLRCTECNTLLAPGRLAEKEGEPFCNRCYARVHGPAGAGYALLGKAGG